MKLLCHYPLSDNLTILTGPSSLRQQYIQPVLLVGAQTEAVKQFLLIDNVYNSQLLST